MMTQDEILDDFEELVQRTADAIGIDLDEALASCYYTEGFSHFVSSMTAPLLPAGVIIAWWGLHPLKDAALPRRRPRRSR